MPCYRPFPVLLAAASLALLRAPAAGQQVLFTIPLDSGQLVRLHLDDGRLLRGRLLRPLTAQSPQVTFCRYPAPPCRDLVPHRVDSVSVATLADIEVARGTHLWRGAAIGAAIGVLWGVLAGAAYNGFCDSAECGAPVPVWALTGAIGIGAWGALFGSQSTTWGPAP